jgi:hypothetical protein
VARHRERRGPQAASGRLAVLGGGISGLSVAHALAERGYAVTVHEHYDALGDKAHSTNAPGTGAGGRTPLPGEHDFRFLPGFSRNVPDTVRGIPFAGKADGVRGNLRSGTEALFARGSGRPDGTSPSDGTGERGLDRPWGTLRSLGVEFVLGAQLRAVL